MNLSDTHEHGDTNIPECPTIGRLGMRAMRTYFYARARLALLRARAAAYAGTLARVDSRRLACAARSLEYALEALRWRTEARACTAWPEVHDGV